MYRSGKWMEWSALTIKKCLDVWANSLKKYNKKHIENNEESTHVDIWGLKDKKAICMKNCGCSSKRMSSCNVALTLRVKGLYY